MNFSKRLGLLAFIVGIAFGTACTKKDSDSSKSASEAKTQTAASTATAGETCADGKPAQAFQVDCMGTWAFVQRKNVDGNVVNNCEFNWTQQSCDTRGLKTHRNPVCYGVTGMDFGNAGGSPEKCGAKFGNPPKPIKATLYCCEK